MELEQAMRRLEAAGSEQARKAYRRHGMPEPLFGVSYADLGTLRKAIGTDHALALGLWATGNGDARVLATMVADPARASVLDVERWARDLDSYVLTDAFMRFASRTPHARALEQKWIDVDHERLECVAWGLLAFRAMESPAVPDGDFHPWLARIERTVHGAKNRVRHSMNMALIAIGGRSDALAKRAIGASRRIGRVEVDHGDTDCKTPEAGPYILKIRERQKAKKPKNTVKAKARKGVRNLFRGGKGS
jgi:3-methyladenine DNA glycosylase AlkD